MQLTAANGPASSRISSRRVEDVRTSAAAVVGGGALLSRVRIDLTATPLERARVVIGEKAAEVRKAVLLEPSFDEVPFSETVLARFWTTVPYVWGFILWVTTQTQLF
jgi:hypothetical protein